MSNPLTRDDLRLFPEPAATAFFSGRYEFDPVATTAYYKDLFAGQPRRVSRNSSRGWAKR